MIVGVRQKTIVGEGGFINIQSPELQDGSLVEVIVLLDSEEQDTTDYLLSIEANRRHLEQALRESQNRSNYIYVDSQDL